MPVVSCPDCGRDVSTMATACPHCGRPSPAGLTPIATSATVPLQEETLRRGRASGALLIGKIAALAATLIALPLIAHFVATASTDLETGARIVRIGWWVTAALAALEFVALFNALARIRGVQYTITNQRVLVESGILTRSLSELDLRYIDDSQFFQGVMQRLLGIGNVTIISSDKESPTLVLRGIRDPRAIRELIRSRAYQVSQRQIFTRAT